jgi:hypothetical protein
VTAVDAIDRSKSSSSIQKSVQPSKSTSDTYTDKLEALLQGKESTDAFLQDLVFEMSDVLLIVMNDLGANDQRFLHRQFQKHWRDQEHAPKAIYVVHNFKHSACLADAHALYEEQVTSLYGSETAGTLIYHTINGTRVPYLQTAQARHFLIGNDNDYPTHKYNEASFELLRSTILHNFKLAAKFNVFESLMNHSRSGLARYANNVMSFAYEVVGNEKDREKFGPLCAGVIRLKLHGTSQVVSLRTVGSIGTTGVSSVPNSRYWDAKLDVYDDDEYFYVCVEAAGVFVSKCIVEKLTEVGQSKQAAPPLSPGSVRCTNKYHNAAKKQDLKQEYLKGPCAFLREMRTLEVLGERLSPTADEHRHDHNQRAMSYGTFYLKYEIPSKMTLAQKVAVNYADGIFTVRFTKADGYEVVDFVPKRQGFGESS